MIYDDKNRPHKLICASAEYTHLQCVETGTAIKVANGLFTACGFSTAPRDGRIYVELVR